MDISQPVPELPVLDVEKAQQYYRDVFAFKIEWIHPSKEIGAVSKGETAIFFRKRAESFEPVVHWIYCADIDAAIKELKMSGANIVEDIEDKPWGLRQFTAHDMDGHVFYFHHG